MRANFRIKCEKSDAIALMMGEVRQARRQDPRIIDLLDPGGAIIHGSTDVQQYQDAGVRFALVQLDIQAVGPRKHIPVNAPDLVPRHVLSVRCEVDTETRVGRPMQTLNKSLDNRARNEFQVLNLDQDLRINKPIRRRLFYYWCTHKIIL